MRVHFKPKTKLGKWSAWLIVAFAVYAVAIALGVIKIVDSAFFRTLVIALVPASPLGVAAFITGLISVLRRKERSVAVGLAVVFGSLGILGLIVWIRLITFPH